MHTDCLQYLTLLLKLLHASTTNSLAMLLVAAVSFMLHAATAQPRSLHA